MITVFLSMNSLIRDGSIAEIFNDETLCVNILKSFDDRRMHSEVNCRDDLEVCKQWRATRTEATLLDVVRMFCEHQLVLEPLSERKKEKFPNWRATRQKFILDFLQKDIQKLPAERTPLEIATVFAIQSRTDDIRAYFDALKEVAQRCADEGLTGKHFQQDLAGFLLHVHIAKGFLAPLHLISGLMNQFEEEWDPILEDFDKTMARALNRRQHHHYRKTQMFTFDCWLLWGPSIPMCGCGQWTKCKAGNGDPMPALQFGFGDENNSLPVIQVFDDIAEGDESSAYRTLLSDLSGRHDTLGHMYKLHARPVAAEHAGDRVCCAQSSVASVGSGSSGVVLDFIEAFQVHMPALYYSAYVWAMFVLCKVDGSQLTPVFPPKGVPSAANVDGWAGLPGWEGLLPVFVHGNIADNQTYAVSKAQLVYKALCTIASAVGANPLGAPCALDDADQYKFVYVCAIDDPGGCGYEHGTPGDQSIYKMIETAVSVRRRFHDLKGKIGHYNQLSEDVRGWFSACHLPDLINSFYGHLGAPPPSEESPVEIEGSP